MLSSKSQNFKQIKPPIPSSGSLTSTVPIIEPSTDSSTKLTTTCNHNIPLNRLIINQMLYKLRQDARILTTKIVNISHYKKLYVTSTYRDLINWLMVSFTDLNLQKTNFNIIHFMCLILMLLSHLKSNYKLRQKYSTKHQINIKYKHIFKKQWELKHNEIYLKLVKTLIKGEKGRNKISQYNENTLYPNNI